MMTPYTIDISDDMLTDLRERIGSWRAPDELPDVGWDYGVPVGYLRELAEHWRSGYDWRAVERRLNAWPQYVTEIDGEQIHVAHVRSSRRDAEPLLLVHGWPSTVADFLPIAQLLAEPDDPDAPAFHVVMPSLPGFAFSGPTKQRGWGTDRMAAAFVALMAELGYESYFVQGGDFGSLICPQMGRIAPDHVRGVHVNALVTLGAIDWRSDDPLAGFTDDERDRAYRAGAQWQQRSGYATIQSTRPQTLAHGLADSPVGLLAWNLEWFVDYDPTTTQLTLPDMDDVLTDVTVFWATNTIASAARMYKESQDAFGARESSGVPTGVAVFPGDNVFRTLAERMHNVVHWSTFDRGGHFASLLAPDLLVDDIRAFVIGLD